MPPVAPRVPLLGGQGVALSEGCPHPDMPTTVSLTRRYFLQHQTGTAGGRVPLRREGMPARATAVAEGSQHRFWPACKL